MTLSHDRRDLAVLAMRLLYCEHVRLCIFFTYNPICAGPLSAILSSSSPSLRSSDPRLLAAYAADTGRDRAVWVSSSLLTILSFVLYAHITSGIAPVSPGMSTCVTPGVNTCGQFISLDMFTQALSALVSIPLHRSSGGLLGVLDFIRSSSKGNDNPGFSQEEEVAAINIGKFVQAALARLVTGDNCALSLGVRLCKGFHDLATPINGHVQ